MANTLVIALLGLLCLVPMHNAAPSSSSQESSEEVSKALVERLKWAVLALTEFAELQNEILEQGPKVMNAVLNDPKVTEVKTEAMEKELKKLTDFLEKFNKIKAEEKKENAFELADKLDDVFEEFHAENHKDVTPEAIIIEKSMKEHGLLDIRKGIVSHYESFVAKFKTEVDAYLNGLTPDQKAEEKVFREWYDKFNAEPDIDNKIEMLDNLFDEEDN